MVFSIRSAATDLHAITPPRALQPLSKESEYVSHEYTGTSMRRARHLNTSTLRVHVPVGNCVLGFRRRPSSVRLILRFSMSNLGVMEKQRTSLFDVNNGRQSWPQLLPPCQQRTSTWSSYQLQRPRSHCFTQHRGPKSKRKQLESIKHRTSFEHKLAIRQTGVTSDQQ